MASTFGGTTPTSAGIGVSPTDWRVQLLQRIGAPVTWPNLNALQAWALSESGYNSRFGTNLAGPLAYNPLAITDSYGVPTVGNVNSAGVKIFSGTSAGVDATARFLEHGYSPVIQALKDSNPQALFTAVNQSGWCSGCEGGQYPVALATWVHGGGTFPGAHGGFEGSSGSTPAARAAQAAANSSDTGGLYGGCGGGTSVPLLPFSLPPFGCYVLNTVEFLVPAIGGGILMLVGAYFVVSPALRRTIQTLPVGGVVGAVAGGVTAAAGAPKARRETRQRTADQEQRADEARTHQTTLRAEREKQARARTSQLRAQARTHRLRATQEKLATGSPTRLSAVEEGRLRRAQSRVGNRHPERMAG